MPVNDPWAAAGVSGAFNVGTIGPITGNVLSNYSFAQAGTLSGAQFNPGIDLKGDADIKIDGVSLKDFMQQVTLRLNLLVPNPQLEQQWEELRTLGDAYRAVEKECLAKAKVWDILKRD